MSLEEERRCKEELIAEKLEVKQTKGWGRNKDKGKGKGKGKNKGKDKWQKKWNVWAGAKKKWE